MTSPPLPSLPQGEGWGEGVGNQRCNLHGLGVLITRPQHQAKPLFDAIIQNGGEPVLFPAIEIGPSPAPELCKQQLQNATVYDDLIFTSPNAVTYAIANIAIDHQRVFAIGGTTAKMLQLHHIQHHLPTGEKADSENLLKYPELNSMQGRRVLIIRGNGGRSLLGDTLIKRGASVDYAEVYQRRCPNVDATSLLGKWPKEIDVVITTSNTIIDNLLHLCSNDPVVLRTPLVVISPRMLKHAQQRGFKYVYTARGPVKSEILNTLCHILRIAEDADIM